MSEDNIISFPQTQKEETEPVEQEQTVKPNNKEWYEVRFYFELPMVGSWVCEANSPEEARDLFEECETKYELIELHEYQDAFKELCDVRLPPESFEVIGPTT